MNTNSYIPIVRHFRDTSEEMIGTPLRRLLRELRPEKALTWKALIGPTAGSATVLLAASGTGKTTELRALVAALRERGVRAVFSEAAAVAEEGVRASLNVQESEALNAWLACDAPAVVVVDAVDEIHLRRQSLGRVMRALARDLDLATRRVQLIVSARNGSWSRDYTAQLTDLLRQAKEKPYVRIVTFEPIDRRALRTLVASHGVRDTEAFMRAFEEDELDGLLDLRPCDVELFVDYWRRHGRFGRWSDILAAFVDLALEETNRARERTQTLSAEEARYGLRRIAAASILTKTPHVAVPLAGRVPGAMSARRLFDDWPMPKLSELFENPFFVQKGVDAVQLPQGALTHFLAGRWFAERSARGAATESVRRALLVRVHDEAEPRIPESRRPIVGWACSEDAELRERLIEAHPDVVLYEGDPERLSDREIACALRRLLANATGGGIDAIPTPATVRKLARPSLAETILSLLEQYSTSKEVQCHLLRFAELGRHRECVDHALVLALDAATGEAVRAGAIRVVAAAGDEASRLQLAALLPKVPDGDSIRAALLRALITTRADRRLLVAFIAAGGEIAFQQELGKAASQLSVAELDAILEQMGPTLTSTYETKQTIATFNAAIPVLIARIRRAGERSPRIAELLFAVERLSRSNPFYLSTEDGQKLSDLLSEQPELRRALWRQRMEAASQDGLAFTLHTDPAFGALEKTDLAWLFDVGAENAAMRLDLHPVMDRLLGQLTDDERRAMMAEGSRSDIRERITQTEAQRAQQELEQRAREEAQSRRAAETLSNHRRELEPLRHGIETGENLEALVSAWRHLAEQNTARVARIDVATLATLVGDELVTAFVAGFKACWRRQAVDLPRPGVNETPYVYLAGLTGLTLEIRDGLDLRSLSLCEAELAATYGLYELNAFPYWFEDLAATQPNAVAKVLAAAIELDWGATTEHGRVLRFASGALERTRSLMRDRVLHLLDDGPPAHQQAIHYAVDALLGSVAEQARVAGLVRREVTVESDDDRCREWLRAWAHFAPLDAAVWLEAGLLRDAARFSRLVIRTAELLEFDFDDRFGRTAKTALVAPSALAAWARLLSRVIGSDHDRTRAGGYGPGSRDHAKDFRRRCIERLARDTSVQGRAALRALRDDATTSEQTLCLDQLLEKQARETAEATVTVWTEDDVVQVEAGDEKRPRTLDELFRLVQSHIRRIGKLLENDDFSYRRMFKPTTSETEIQLWAASSLKQVARGLYSVIRENAVDDDKEIDISAFADGVGRVVVEIKPLNKRRYTFQQLCEVIESQLAARYMQPPEVRHGILLLVLHESREWRIAGKRVYLDGLRDELRAYASQTGARLGKTIAVEAIDAVSVPADARRPTAAPLRSKKARTRGRQAWLMPRRCRLRWS